MAQYLKDPEGNTDINLGASFEAYNVGLRDYVEEENKWLEMQHDFINRWDFKLVAPWYIKQAAEYQWKMYEGYHDDAKYLIETSEATGSNEEVDYKFTEARNRRDEFESKYFEFFE